MGSIIQYVCGCGYRSDEIFEGRGMTPTLCHTAAARCDRCREIVAVNENANRPRCPRCRKDLKPPFESLDEWDERDEEPELACPRCDRSPLDVEVHDLWD